MLQIQRRYRRLSKNRRTHGKNRGIHTAAEIALNPGKHFRVSTIAAGCLVEVNYFSSGKVINKKEKKTGKRYSLMKQGCYRDLVNTAFHSRCKNKGAKVTNTRN